MECSHCGHELNMKSFVYHKLQKCPHCGCEYMIDFPAGTGFVPVVIAIIPALYMFLSMHYSWLVSLSIFILFYWAIDIIMNILLIHFHQYEINEWK